MKRYKLRGDTFIDDVDGVVLVGFGGVLDELNRLNDENEELKKELFEIRKDYILETYADNPIRRDEKLKALEKVFMND